MRRECVFAQLARTFGSLRRGFTGLSNGAAVINGDGRPSWVRRMALILKKWWPLVELAHIWMHLHATATVLLPYLCRSLLCEPHRRI